MTNTDTEKEIIRLSTDKFRWMTTPDPDRLEELFDKDMIFVYMNGQLQNKRDWLLQLRQGVFNFEKIFPQQMTAQAYGDVCVIFGRAIFQVHMHGFQSRWNIIFTEVYAKKEGIWKLVNVHSSTC